MLLYYTFFSKISDKPQQFASACIKIKMIPLDNIYRAYLPECPVPLIYAVLPDDNIIPAKYDHSQRKPVIRVRYSRNIAFHYLHICTDKLQKKAESPIIP